PLLPAVKSGLTRRWQISQVHIWIAKLAVSYIIGKFWAGISPKYIRKLIFSIILFKCRKQGFVLSRNRLAVFCSLAN
ncbi:MAG: hypothetical protein MSD82_07800, partial [Prevotella sp.]|nr:hypothetical protein [Prevotella sp.]